MPELPDITVYVEALERRIVGAKLAGIHVEDLFILRTARPPIDVLVGQRVTEIRRLGKRIALRFENNVWLVIHLMIAGRLQWSEVIAQSPARNTVAAFRFETGSLFMTEAGRKRRASLHVVEGDHGLAGHDPGGLEVGSAKDANFADRLTRANHTLKRALTDPHLFSGIGNAYSDEILHRARLSPITLTQKLSAEEIARLQVAVVNVLKEWTQRLRTEAAGGFPTKVTAFHPQMAVHGKFGQPCPVCGTAVQRIVYAENEVNYCPQCQTGGRLLADRSLSRLLKQDWPRSLEEAEAMRERHQPPSGK